MPTAITNDVKITVEVTYQGSNSKTDLMHAFAYRITIINSGGHTIKLLRRHWFIFDTLIGHKEVEGEGVVGEQPIIEPGEKHVYVSGVAIESLFGYMHGNYLMERLIDGNGFKVKIPLFKLIPNFICN